MASRIHEVVLSALKMSLRGYSSLHSVEKRCSSLIARGDLDGALRLIHDAVDFVLTEPLCTTQVASSPKLDALCQQIGSANLALLDRDCRSAHNLKDQSVFAYIVTKLQRSGGHTRIIEDFIRARPSARHIVLSTELCGRSDVDYLQTRLADMPNASFESMQRQVGYHERLTWLQRRLLEIRPKKAYLFNHHQDSIAVAAVQPDMGFEIGFYHHGDHHLCLGIHLPYAEHIDPHPMGYFACRQDLGIDNVYLPLTVEDKGARPAEWQFMQGGSLTTCTAARSNKVEIPYFVSYIDIVPELLKATGGRHIHIGRLTPWARLKIKRGLRRLGIQTDKFVYIPWVPSIWKAVHEHRVDLYVASFPYGGGLTLIEVMGAGVPVALHKHLYSRVLSGIDLGYPGAFSWRIPQELLDFCMKLTPDSLLNASREARRQYQQYHSHHILERFLGESGYKRLLPGTLKGNFINENDERAFWMARQISFSGLVMRKSYRLLRAIRTRYL